MTTTKTKAIAIDGPSGAGKSTVAKAVAKALGFQYIDTGAMYRAVTLKVLRCSVNPQEEGAVCAVAKDCSVILKDCGENTLVLLDGEDVSREIREVAVTAAVSTVCSYPLVREAMVEQQRVMASCGGVVMDGRDIGTNVLPNACLKVFLTASSEVRGKRRFAEWQEKAIGTMSLDEVIEDINRRDKEDSSRAVNPLKQAKDAILLDNSTMTVAETTTEILELWKENSVCFTDL